MRLRKWLGVVLGVQLGMALPYAGADVTMAAGEPSSDPEQMRIERLAGLGRLWGAVKFFHPALSYRDIDWDGALITAIPKVRAAKTVEEYRAAIQDFLTVLKDPATFAVLETQEQDSLSTGNAGQSAPSVAPGAHYRVIESAIIVNGLAMAELAMRGDPAESERVTASLKEAMAKAKGVIFDLRFSPGQTTSAKAFLSFYLERYLRAQIAALIAAPVTLGTIRLRQHYGYAPQDGSTSGNYHSSLLTVAPESLPGWRSRSAPPMPLAFVVNASTPAVSDILSGLQAARLATIVEEAAGETSVANSDNLSVPLKLSEGVKVYVRVGELLAPDGRPGFAANLRVQAAPGGTDMALQAALKGLSAEVSLPSNGEPNTAAVPVPLRDKTYSDMTFPNTEYRLLALFRFWTVVNYFFPYKNLMDRPWDPVLVEFIPKFEANKTAIDYQLTVMLLAARLQDSHVNVGNAGAAREYIGAYTPPIVLGAVEGRPVVRAFPEPADAAGAGIGIGDEILAVDGETVDKLRSRLQPIIAASTPQAFSRDVEPQLLRGSRDSIATLRIRDASNAVREVRIKRTLDLQRHFREIRWLPAYRQQPGTYGLLPSGIAYIDLERLAPGEVDAAMAAAERAPAIIFDLRSYPRGTGFVIAPRLVKTKSNKPVIGAIFSPPFLRGDFLAYEDAALIPKLTFAQPLLPADKPAYQGRVAVLIDEWTQSQAEHTCLMFAAATDVIFIGSPTAGANGDVSNFVLPGHLTVSFTGQEVRFADNRQLQRVGIQPNIRVEPTHAGIRDGRDEVLDAAVSFLQRQTTP